MSSIEFNKVFGAVILAALTVFVFALIGNGLVKPKPYDAAKFKIAAKASASKTVAKKAPLEPIGPLLSSASAEKGAVVFKKCAACHTSAKGDKNKLGPNLWNIVNAPRAGKAGFKYSDGMKKKPGNWKFESLNEFLVKPKAYVPRTKMAFGGIKKASQRADLIVYLRNLADSPAKLP
jgi:cytochrome c